MRSFFLLKQNTFFFRNFPHKCTYIQHCLELGSSKNYLNLARIFILRLFKLAANRTECFRFEQRSVIKFLVAEKCKPYENYCYDVYGEACFSQKNLYRWAKHAFPVRAWIKKTVLVVETHWLSGKKKFFACRSIKKVMRIIFWDMKSATINSTFHEWSQISSSLQDSCQYSGQS